ncbi:MAG: hypothetical protein ABI589_09065, partial [Burkholderiales bacterium]
MTCWHVSEVWAKGSLCRAALLAVALVLVVPPVAGAQDEAPTPAASREIRYGPSRTGFGIMFFRTAHGDAKVDTADAREVFVSFPQAAPAFDPADLQSRAKDWLAGVNLGHDALLLHLAPGVRAHSELNGSIVTVWLTADAAGTAEPAETTAADAAGGAQRLDVLRARMQLRDQRLHEARAQFETLRKSMPESSEPVAGLAQVEGQA